MLLREHFARGGILETEDCMKIVKMATEVLKKEPNVLALSDPVTVVGDIHGQFYDLLKILDVGGDISTVKYSCNCHTIIVTFSSATTSTEGASEWRWSLRFTRSS